MFYVKSALEFSVSRSTDSDIARQRPRFVTASDLCVVFSMLIWKTFFFLPAFRNGFVKRGRSPRSCRLLHLNSDAQADNLLSETLTAAMATFLYPCERFLALELPTTQHDLDHTSATEKSLATALLSSVVLTKRITICATSLDATELFPM